MSTYHELSRQPIGRWGPIRESDADGSPGHYYVTVRSSGRVSLALGPFTARRADRGAHLRALGYVKAVRRYVSAHDRSPGEPWYEYGTSRLPLCSNPPRGKLNEALRLS